VRERRAGVELDGGEGEEIERGEVKKGRVKGKVLEGCSVALMILLILSYLF